ncbi:MAG: amino acid dehydrogenase [Gammaproteobacteria bacterium]|nr:amino acid dehydrogenase [Gammaproteobacteria bacterium]
MTNLSSIFDLTRELPNGGLHIKEDPETGLKAIIAVHSTALGPALGGCRFLEYNSVEDAIADAIKLARGMSYKAAITGVPTGGGKAVIMKPKGIKSREAFFGKFGQFVEQLGGQYITAMDSGTSLLEMDIIARHTKHIASVTAENSISHGDPSPYTAFGLLKGIHAAVTYKFKTESLENIKVAVKGVGHVGMDLVARLHNQGAKIFISDINKESLEHCADKYGAIIVDNDTIHQTACDVYSPCALGGAINNNTIDQLNCSIVAGCANNQLARKEYGEQLHKKNILYAPDYVINAGGLIFAYALYANLGEDQAFKQIENIYNSLLEIFDHSKYDNIPTSDIADRIAIQRIEAAQQKLDAR